MGMDVFGKAPATEDGEYFRRSVWGWRPLADFVCSLYPELTEACTYWQSNDGDGLDAAGSLALAEAIEADLANGTVAAYVATRDAALAALPMEPCEFCDGTGLRTDEVGRKYGYDKPRDEATGRGGCNGCHGTGEREPWARAYPFEAQDAADFAQFLRASGGFEIC